MSTRVEREEYVDPIILVYSRLDRPTYYMWPFGVLTLRGFIALAIGGLIGFLLAMLTFSANPLLSFILLILIPGILVVYGKRRTWPPLEYRFIGFITHLFAPKHRRVRERRRPAEVAVKVGEGGFIDFVYPVPWPDGTVVDVYIHDRHIMRTRVVNGEVYVRAVTPTRNVRYMVRLVAGKNKVIKFWLKVI